MEMAQPNQSAQDASSLEWLGWTLTMLAYLGSAVISIASIWFVGKQLFH